MNFLRDTSVLSEQLKLFNLMSQTIPTILGCIVFIINIVFRCLLFNEAGVPFWTAIIPLYNKYQYGKIAGEEKWGIRYVISYVISSIFSIITMALGIIAIIFVLADAFNNKGMDKATMGLIIGAVICSIILIIADVFWWISAIKIYPKFCKNLNMNSAVCLFYFLLPSFSNICVYIIYKITNKNNIHGIDNDCQDINGHIPDNENYGNYKKI